MDKDLKLEDLNREEESEDAIEEEKQARRARKKKTEYKDEEEPSVLHEVVSWIMTFAVAIVAALLLKNFVIINATVPTGSMENTILPGDDLLGFRLAYLFSEPERGDIIIFKFPDDESQKFIKRIIGLPGELVQITDGKIYIDGSEEPLEEDYLKEEWVVSTGPYEFVVPEGCYFVMGDNRNNSKDSRYWEQPFVTEDEIIGKAEFIYFPFNRFTKLK